MLHARLLELQQMDRTYAAQFNEQESTIALEISQLSLHKAEQALVKTLDSLEVARTGWDDRTSSDLWKLTTYFKTIMENRQFLKAVSREKSNGNNLPVDKNALMALEAGIKRKRITHYIIRQKIICFCAITCAIKKKANGK